MGANSITPRRFFLLVLLLSAGPLAFALISQYAFGFEPCQLCQYQRIPYWALIALSLMALIIPGVDQHGSAWIVPAIFACGAVLAFYHVGVEQHWWASTCSAQGNLSMSFDDFRAGPLKPILKSCDTIDWMLFGMSMATYNMVLSAVLAISAATAAWAMAKR